VLTVPPTFRWDGEFVSAVVQVSIDGTFGAASRFDFGPYELGGALLTDADWAALLEESDGSRALLWRVVAVGANGETAVTAPRRFYAAQPTDLVSIPFGANLFVPAHIVIPLGTTVTWWNDPVSAGNLQSEPTTCSSSTPRASSSRPWSSSTPPGRSPGPLTPWASTTTSASATAGRAGRATCP
jgi:hypothetical protein